jgi:hypothetical protein
MIDRGLSSVFENGKHPICQFRLITASGSYAQVVSRKSCVEDSCGYSRDLLRGVAGFRERFRARDGLEISKPDLELDGSTSQPLAAQPSPAWSVSSRSHALRISGSWTSLANVVSVEIDFA